MSRFREEVYESRSYKAWDKTRGAQASKSGIRPVQSGPAVRPERSLPAERRALRLDYFKSKAKGRKKVPPEQGRMI